nr:MAG TPA: hypothetical protein [Caudoviricetes sp.]
MSVNCSLSHVIIMFFLSLYCLLLELFSGE